MLICRLAGCTSALHRHHRHLVIPSQTMETCQICGVYAMLCPGVSGACLCQDACHSKHLLLVGAGDREEEGGCLSGVATHKQEG